MKVASRYELVERRFGRGSISVLGKLPDGFVWTGDEYWGLLLKRSYRNRFGNVLVEVYRMKT